MSTGLRSHARIRAAIAAAVALIGAAVIVVAADGDERGAPAPRGAAGWGSLAPSIFERTEVGAARIGDRVYVVGGFISSGGTTSKVARYDISADRWRRMPDLPIAVNHAGVTALRGRLYVLGGNWPARGQNAKSARLHRFSPKRKDWLRLPDAPTARGALGLVGKGRKLFAVGGLTKSNERVRKLEIFNVKRKRWRRGAKLPTGRNHIAAAILGGRLYVTGGRPGPTYNAQTTVESYSFKSGNWRAEPSLEVARSGHATVAARGGLVAFGGEELGIPGGQTIEQVEFFDPAAGEWTPLSDMVTPRHGLGGVAKGARVFALEGGPQPGLHYSRALEFLDVP
jgi:N-acetylneuraminic acid mutarotase